MEIKNAVITSEVIINADYGGLNVLLYLDLKGSTRIISGHNEHFITRVMEIAGVTNWRSLANKNIRVKCDIFNVYSIGHILNDDWFDVGSDVGDV